MFKIYILINKYIYILNTHILNNTYVVHSED